MKHYGDITKLHGFDLHPVDVITGGSPCQDLSVAGLRKGLKHESAGHDETTRSGLYMDQIRIVKEMREHDVRTNRRTGVNIRPRYMVWENVPGAFSSNGGEDFRAVLEEAAKVADESAVIPRPPKGKWTNSGAIVGDGWSIAWRVFDAQFWGVPQRRRRIYLVADFAGESASEILFKRNGLSRNFTESRSERERVAGDTATSTTETGIDFYNQALTGGVAKSLNSAETDSDHIPCVIKPVAIENHPNDSRVKIDESGTIQSLTGRMGTGGGNVPLTMQTTYSMQRSNEYIESNVASTQSARQYKSATDIVATKSVRRLTPLECERLQGFPDGWTSIPDYTKQNGKTVSASDSVRYKALGNSVAIPNVTYVLEGIAIMQNGLGMLGSLFDGIGGFPYVWEQICGQGSALWASEIEEFPIAVTKYRFGED